MSEGSTRSVVIALGVLTAAASAVAQPANDLCSGAQLLSCNSSITFDNSTATQSASDPAFSCHFGGAAPGFYTMWFRFTASNTSALISTCRASGPSAVNDTLLAVYSVGNMANPCGTLVEIGCNDDSPGCGFMSSVNVAGLTVGNTYYIQVAGWSVTNFGSITLDLFCPDPPAPANDSCSGAIAISCNSSVNFDNTAATGSASDPPFPCYNGGGPPDSRGFFTLWYKIVPTTPHVVLRTCNSAQVTDTLLGLYSVGNAGNPCGTLTQIGCNDDFCGASTFLSTLVANGLTPGATYYIQVAGGAAGVARGQGTLDVMCVSQCAECPPGSMIENEPMCGLAGDTTNGGCNSTPPVFGTLPCGQTVCGTTGAENQTRDSDWYSFSLATAGPVTLTVRGEFPVEASLIDISACPNISLAARSSNGPCQAAVVTANMAAGTHYVVIRTDNLFSNLPCGAHYTATLTCGVQCKGDVNGDNVVDGGDIQSFLNCYLGLGGGVCCPCADMDSNSVFDITDVTMFVAKLLAATPC